MKFHRTLLCTALIACHLTLITSSCANDAYDKGEGDYSLLQAELADVHVDRDLCADYFVTDDDVKFNVTNSYSNNWMKTPDSTYRAVTYFSKRGDNLADLKGLNRVGVIAPKRLKDLKTDPVHFESAWMSQNSKYLNLSVYVLMGSTDNENAIQRLGCHIDTLQRNADGTETMQLTLYHDQGGVPEYYSQRTYLSIPLSNAMTDSVCLTIRTYDGIVRKTFCLGTRSSRLSLGTNSKSDEDWKH